MIAIFVGFGENGRSGCPFGVRRFIAAFWPRDSELPTTFCGRSIPPHKKSGNELPHSKTKATMSACNATMHAYNKSLPIDETTMQTSIAALQVNNGAMGVNNVTV